MTTAKLIYNGQEYDIPVIVGTENEGALDIRKLRDTTGLITYDPGYANTGSCQSAITFIDGDRGILRYRGYPIEELAGSVRFSAAAYLMIYGRMPS
ncbi:MAG TPA: citrate/2-methylcitrate synthase, partial [Candidatus Hydrogenedentes bacterium]|nr:citrate/2-methylcitrate synthase [Candidatus Hydrogenedentota bacterium]